MEIKTYCASTMHEALLLVRRELGPDAAVLHTRELRPRRLFGLVPAGRQIEVTASAEVNVPSRLPSLAVGERAASVVPDRHRPQQSAATENVQGQLAHLQSMVAELCKRSQQGPHQDLPDGLFKLFTDLLDAEVPENLARELVERTRAELGVVELSDSLLAKARMAGMIEADIHTTGPIKVTPGRRRLVALVGPTGVGKTTTIAKLAANYRLKEKRNIGLITVDTYRIGAVEQLRTYAEIIDLPMQVVSTPREMREAVARMDDMELILMDTAGRSPKDEVKIQELRAFIAEAAADEVHLVLSSTAGSRTLEQTAERFAAVGTTALLLTKLDEAACMGNVLPVLRSSRLPLSYLTTGQNVPEDIETADAHRLARTVLGMD